MTKGELIEDIQQRSGLNRAQSKAAVEALVASVTCALQRGEEVRLTGFGSFRPDRPRRRPGRATRAPALEVKRPASRTARFRVSAKR